MSNARRNPTDNEAILLVNEVDNMSTLLTNFNVREKGQKKRYEAAHIYPLNPTKRRI